LSKQKSAKKDVKGPQNETLHQKADLNLSGKILGNAILSSIFLTVQFAAATFSNNMFSVITYVNKILHQKKTNICCRQSKNKSTCPAGALGSACDIRQGILTEWER
jgi:hypothetical protein